LAAFVETLAPTRCNHDATDAGMRNPITGIAGAARAPRAATQPPRRQQRDERAAFIKKMSSHGTIAKRGGLAKRPRSARGLRFSSSRVGQKPVGNSFDHLVGAQEGCCGRRGARFCGQIGDFVVAAQVCAATEIAQFWGLPLEN
jgi:hypothetical protein